MWLYEATTFHQYGLLQKSFSLTFEEPYEAIAQTQEWLKRCALLSKAFRHHFLQEYKERGVNISRHRTKEVFNDLKVIRRTIKSKVECDYFRLFDLTAKIIQLGILLIT